MHQFCHRQLDRTNLRSALVAGLLLCCATGSVQAEIFRWVDANGVVNYTQQKPQGVEAVVLGKGGDRARVRYAPATPEPSSETATSESTATTGSRELQPAERQAELNEAQRAKLAQLKADQAKAEAKLAADKQANCKQAESMLSQLTERSRIRLRGEDGSERVIGEDERQDRISRAQLTIAENCV